MQCPSSGLVCKQSWRVKAHHVVVEHTQHVAHLAVRARVFTNGYLNVRESAPLRRGSKDVEEGFACDVLAIYRVEDEGDTRAVIIHGAHAPTHTRMPFAPSVLLISLLIPAVAGGKTARRYL